MAGLTRGVARLSRFFMQKRSLLQFLFLGENSLDLLHFDENEVWVVAVSKAIQTRSRSGFSVFWAL
jgi:hypothetical protein